MNRGILTLLFSCLALQAGAQRERPSLLESDPDVVYLERTLKEPIELAVIKEAPVFSDKNGSHRLGFLKAAQKVKLEAITEKAYKVRGEGTNGGIAGWVAPWAFTSKDPQFVDNLKKLYSRQIEVQNLIASMRRTSSGEAGSWEFIDYEEVKHYVTRIDPATGAIYRQLSHVTQEEKSKTAVEFENGLVTAITESEDRKGGNVRIIVPPLIFGW